MPEGLELLDVHHRFGRRQVIAGISLGVDAGEIVCLLGPSGCGKTTTLRLAAGLEHLQQGEIRIMGEVVANKGTFVAPEDRGVGLVLQDYALFPHLNVIDNVKFGLDDRASSATTDVAKAHLAAVGLAGFEENWPHTLSGGEQQRVALARALAPAPRVMLMDEPFSGLDVTTRHQVRASSRSLLKERGVPTLIVTHDPEEALELSDRIAVMRDGKIVQLGTPDEILNQPADDYVAEMFRVRVASAGQI